MLCLVCSRNSNVITQPLPAVPPPPPPHLTLFTQHGDKQAVTTTTDPVYLEVFFFLSLFLAWHETKRNRMQDLHSHLCNPSPCGLRKRQLSQFFYCLEQWPPHLSLHEGLASWKSIFPHTEGRRGEGRRIMQLRYVACCSPLAAWPSS